MRFPFTVNGTLDLPTGTAGMLDNQGNVTSLVLPAGGLLNVWPRVQVGDQTDLGDDEMDAFGVFLDDYYVWFSRPSGETPHETFTITGHAEVPEGTAALVGPEGQARGLQLPSGEELRITPRIHVGNEGPLGTGILTGLGITARLEDATFSAP